MQLTTKRQVTDRLDRVRASWSGTPNPFDRVLDHAAGFYIAGDIDPRDLRAKIARLESILRDRMPDLVVQRARRSASITPRHVALIVSEPVIVDMHGHSFVSVESHAVVLMADSLHYVSGLLPGSTTPHLFEQMVKRGGTLTSLTEVLLGMSRLWPTLLQMRMRQRLRGQGVPPRAIVTPYGDGLLFAAVEKVSGMPGSGTTAVTVVRGGGVNHRDLTDWYARDGERVNVETKTFVGAAQLKPKQIEVRDRLRDFEREYQDVIADGDWRWRIGLGQPDAAVTAVAAAYMLVTPPLERRESAFDALEAIVESACWIDEAIKNEANQRRNKGDNSPSSPTK